MPKYKIQTGNLKITKAEKKVINSILDSNNISEGKYVEKFQNKWAKYIGTKHCTLFNSGSSALIVGLRALREYMGYPLRIITTPFTYIATIHSILLTGNKPIFVDIDPKTMGMSPDALEKYLSEKNNADVVMPVHIMGIPCEIDKIKKICNEKGLELIEDTCQSYGTKYKGKMLGSYGLWSACSYYIAHTLQCSEMGSLNTNNRYLARLFNSLKSNGRTSTFDSDKEPYYSDKNKDKLDLHPRYYHTRPSGNYRTTEFSAAFAYEQSKKINSIIKKRNDNVKYLNNELKDMKNYITLPKYSKNIAYLGYPLIVNPNLISRKEFREGLESRGIETRPMYGNLVADMPSLKQFKNKYKNKLPNADFIGRNAMYVGCHESLNKDDLNYMIKSIKEVLK